MRRLRIAAVLLVSALLVWWLARPRPIEVEAAAVTRGPLRVTVDEEGETRVRPRFVVAAPVSGQLQRIMLDEGDEVAEGTVVARIEPLPLDPRLEAAATARLAEAEAGKRAADARVE